MGILVAGIFRNSYHGQQFFDPFQLFRFAEALIDLDGLGDNVLDEPAGIEGPVGILEDDLDIFLEGVAALSSRPQRGLALEPDFALGGFKEV